MKPRIEINSQRIRQDFSEKYSDFFTYQDTVIRTPLTIPILSVKHKGIIDISSIRLKLPVDMWVGTRIAISQKTEVEIEYFNPLKNSFDVYKNTDIREKILYGLLKLRQYFDFNDQTGISIKVLMENEVELDHILPSICLLICLLLAINLEKVTVPPHRSISLTSEEKKLLLNLLRQFDNNERFLQEAWGSFSPSLGLVYERSAPLADTIDHMIGMEKSFSPATNDLPFDIYYFSYGETQNNTKDSSSTRKKLTTYIELGRKHLGSYNLPKNTTVRYTDLIEDIAIAVWFQIGINLENPLDIKETLSLIQDLKLFNLLQEVEEGISISTSITETISHYLGSDFCLASYPQSRFCILITPQGSKYRDLVAKAFEDLYEKDTLFHINYLSFQDGIGDGGITLEKNIFQDLYSKHEENKSLLIKDSYDRITYAQSLDEVLNRNYDILLNLIENKIYIQSKGITSKELHSQRMTIDIIKTLLSQKGQEISNQDLPASAYAESKNEMTGKIIIPLKKIVKEKTGKDLLLSCHGSNTHFFLKLAITNISIAQMSRR